MSVKQLNPKRWVSKGVSNGIYIGIYITATSSVENICRDRILTVKSKISGCASGMTTFQMCVQSPPGVVFIFIYIL